MRLAREQLSARAGSPLTDRETAPSTNKHRTVFGTSFSRT